MQQLHDGHAGRRFFHLHWWRLTFLRSQVFHYQVSTVDHHSSGLRFYKYSSSRRSSAYLPSLQAASRPSLNRNPPSKDCSSAIAYYHHGPSLKPPSGGALGGRSHSGEQAGQCYHHPIPGREWYPDRVQNMSLLALHEPTRLGV